MDKIKDWQQFVNQTTFNLDYGSKNYNFFEAIMQHGMDIYNNIIKTDEWTSIDEASGVALDNIGSNYGEYRGEADDAFYRFMIKSNILASHSKGTANDIINLISKSLNVDTNNIVVRPDRVYDNQQKAFIGIPFTILVERLPLSFTTNDFQKRYLIKRIEESVAAGIRIGNISFLDFTNTPLYISASQSVRKRYISTKSVIGS